MKKEHLISATVAPAAQATAEPKRVKLVNKGGEIARPYDNALEIWLAKGWTPAK